MSTETLAVFDASSPKLRAELKRRFPGMVKTSKTCAVVRLPSRFPFDADDGAQLREVAGELVDALGDSYDVLVRDPRGILIVAAVGSPPTSFAAAATHGTWVTRELAGSAAQRRSDQSRDIDTMLRITAVLGKQPESASLEQRVIAVLSSFSAAERSELDAAARRNGYESFEMQVAVLLRSAAG